MIIPVNIIKTYPVAWNRYKVFRDFIQNFYDSVPQAEWHKRFVYKYNAKKRTLVMSVSGVTFSYEWLLHIGASTKTNSSEQTAGYFGEGFKIASLCAIRDFSYNIVMQSGNWKLQVIFIESKIDQQKVYMLAYDVEKIHKRDKSVLVVENVFERDYQSFTTAMASFLYPENPMLGEKIWEGREGALYYRSKNPIDKGLPYVDEYGRVGAVFCSYQMLGTNPFDLVICYNKYKKDDRERNRLYRSDIVDIFERIASYIDAQGAFKMLEKMRRYWHSYQHKRIDLYSWSDTISILVRKIAGDEDYKKIFVEKYPNILCLKKIYSIDDANRRRTAREWYSEQKDLQCIFAKDTFRLFGYKTLEEVCEEHGGFAENDAARNSIEKQCFELLWQISETIFEGFFLFESKPLIMVIRNDTSIAQGVACLTNFSGKHVNHYNMRIRYKLQRVYLKYTILVKERFYQALATYVHELCHMFGGDSSSSFSRALTYAMSILLVNSEALDLFKQKWIAIFAQNERVTNTPGETEP